MAQKTKIGKNSTPSIADPGYFMPIAITGYNAAADCARELFGGGPGKLRPLT